MDLFTPIFLTVASLAMLAVWLLAKDEKVKAAAKKVLTVFVILLAVYGSSGKIIEELSIISNDPSAITVTDPDPAAEPSQGDTQQSSGNSSGSESSGYVIDEDGVYDSKEEVALYLYTYGKLPGNYITKSEAEKLGWSGGSLEKYAPGKCIGGSRFYNNEKVLPEKSGRKYYECDIDTLGASSRGAKRIVYSNDGLIYYTSDHYETFELLYGDE